MGTNRSALAVLVAVAVCGLPPSGAAAAPPAQDERIYTVQPGDTLSSIAETRLDKPSAWKRLQSLNRIANPNLLQPGMTLRIPHALQNPDAAQAEAVLVRGDVRVRQERGDPAVPLSSGARLGAGAVVETGATGLLTLRFADQSRMLVSPNSRLVLSHLLLNPKTGASVTRTTLEAGDAESFVIPLRGIKARYEVKTPTLNLAVRGTVFRVQFEADTGIARAMVTEGVVQAGNAHGETAIPAGSGTTAAPGRAPAPPRALLPAPEPDASAAVVDLFPLRLSWQGVPGAQQYRVELLDGDPVDRLAEVLALEGTSSHWKHLPNGEYRLRVRGVDDQRLEGGNAQIAFKVQAWPAAPLTVAPADGSVAAERVKFRWARAPDAEYLRFQVARDTGFAQRAFDMNLNGKSNGLSVALKPGRYYWRIAAGSAADGLGPFGRVQSFEVAAASAAVDSAGARLLRWRAAMPGERYAVQMDRQGDFAAPFLTAETGVAEAPVPAGAGPLYVRIKRIAPDGFVGEFEAVQFVDLQD